MNELINFLKVSNIAFEENVDAKKLCSFRVGGIARVLIYPKNTDEIKGLYAYLSENKIKNILLGKGSNVLISDLGFDGAVISLGKMNEIRADGHRVFAGAGASMFSLAVAAEKNSLCGLEFAHGIPGSVGGGVYMNAGAYGGEMCQVIDEVLCLDIESGELYTLGNAECDFSYRHSIFKDNKNLIVIGSSFELSEGDATEIRARMDELKASRISKQPLEYPSAGSTFKRPEGYFAGKLIEDAGLKGFAIGGAQVSEKHAGFVINRGGATAKDVKDLILHIQKTVKEKFNVNLECEVEFVE